MFHFLFSPQISPRRCGSRSNRSFHDLRLHTRWVWKRTFTGFIACSRLWLAIEPRTLSPAGGWYTGPTYRPQNVFLTNSLEIFDKILGMCTDACGCQATATYISLMSAVVEVKCGCSSTLVDTVEILSSKLTWKNKKRCWIKWNVVFLIWFRVTGSLYIPSVYFLNCLSSLVLQGLTYISAVTDREVWYWTDIHIALMYSLLATLNHNPHLLFTLHTLCNSSTSHPQPIFTHHLTWHACVCTAGGSWRESTQAQQGHANSTQEGSSQPLLISVPATCLCW